MKELPIAICRECGGEFRQPRPEKLFCRNKCRYTWWRRKQIRGGQAVDMLIEWRATRGAKKGILADLAHMVDGWIREDKS